MDADERRAIVLTDPPRRVKGPKPRPIADRFWCRVDKAPGHGPTGDCWLWMGPPTNKGYGRFEIPHLGIYSAHRTAWLLTHGRLPAPPLILRHECDNRMCVRPDHLVPGTFADNTHDAVVRNRFPTGERHYANVNPELRQKGERNGMARLTAADVLEIRRRCDAGEPREPIASDFGVSSAHVSAIGSRRFWTWLPEDPQREQAAE